MRFLPDRHDFASGTRQLLIAGQNANSIWRWGLGLCAIIITGFALFLVLIILIILVSALKTGAEFTSLITSFNFYTTPNTAFDRWHAIERTLVDFAVVALFVPASLVGFKIAGLRARQVITFTSAISWRIIAVFALVTFVISVSFAGLAMFMTDVAVSFEPLPEGALKLIPVLLVLIAFQATAEELFFRGFLLQLLGKLSQRWWLILVVISLLFTVLHFFNPEFKYFPAYAGFSIATLSLLMTAIALLVGRLEYAIGIHIGWNWSIVLFDSKIDPDLYLGFGVFVVTPDPAPTDYMLQILVLSVLFGAVIWHWRRAKDM